MSNAVSGQQLGDRGISPPGLRPDYKTYRSPYGPNYKVSPNFHGINSIKAGRFGLMMATFGAALGIGGFFFISDIPRVRHDILEKLPVVGGYWRREVPPEDNPF